MVSPPSSTITRAHAITATSSPTGHSQKPGPPSKAARNHATDRAQHPNGNQPPRTDTSHPYGLLPRPQAHGTRGHRPPLVGGQLPRHQHPHPANGGHGQPCGNGQVPQRHPHLASGSGTGVHPHRRHKQITQEGGRSRRSGIERPQGARPAHRPAPRDSPAPRQSKVSSEIMSIPSGDAERLASPPSPKCTAKGSGRLHHDTANTTATTNAATRQGSPANHCHGPGCWPRDIRSGLSILAPRPDYSVRTRTSR